MSCANYIHAVIDGMINGEPFRGTANGIYHRDRNIFSGEIDITERDRQVELLALSSTSIVSTSCSIFSKPVGGAVNLSSLLGDAFSVEILYLIVAGDAHANPFSSLGQVRQQIKMERVADEKWDMAVELTGKYAGPTDITSSPGYAVYLRQYDDRTIEGCYSQRLLDKQNRVVATNLVRRLYRYTQPHVLPFDEVMNYKVLSVVKTEPSPTSVRASFKSQAYYVPAQAADLNIELPATLLVQ